MKADTNLSIYRYNDISIGLYSKNSKQVKSKDTSKRKLPHSIKSNTSLHALKKYPPTFSQA